MAITRPQTDTIISTTQWGIPITDAVNANTTDIVAMKPTAWTDITLLNGYIWENPFQKPQYRKVGDTVQIRGSLYVASANQSAVFVLPAGFRPPAGLRFGGTAFKTGVGGVSIYRGDIDTGGQVIVSEWSALLGQGATFGLLLSFSTI